MTRHPIAETPDYTPEHRLIELCRELRLDFPELISIQFRVDREDGEYQSATFSRAIPKDEE